MAYEFQHESGIYHVQVERLNDGRVRARINDRERIVTVGRCAEGWWVQFADEEPARVQRVYLASAKAQRWASLDGSAYAFSASPGSGQSHSPAVRAGSRGTGSGNVTAPMPGLVRAVLIALGEQVERGQSLLLLEAMKMEIRVSAPVAGRVQRLLAEAGALVERGQLLVEIASGDHSASASADSNVPDDPAR
ncbi:MAG: biotin/lipoyl-containing protein [Aggregatilineales bacterium]